MAPPTRSTTHKPVATRTDNPKVVNSDTDPDIDPKDSEKDTGTIGAPRTATTTVDSDSEYDQATRERIDHFARLERRGHVDDGEILADDRPDDAGVSYTGYPWPGY